MIGRFLGTHAAQIFGGLAGILLIACLVLFALLSSERGSHEKTRLELKAVKVERDRFRDDAARMVQEGSERTARGQAALREQEPRSIEARRQIERIKAAPPAADCTTPAEVMRAGL